jgi:hypothetical protein
MMDLFKDISAKLNKRDMESAFMLYNNAARFLFSISPDSNILGEL